MSQDARITGEDIPDPSVAPPVKIAVFDFDGTCIAGKSPLLLTLHLLRHGELNLLQGVGIGLWGLAYKLHIPAINQGWVRGMVFKAFKGMTKAQADQYMHDFYDQKIAGLFRPEMEQAIRERKQEGCVVMVVSASFEPIIDRMMQFHPFDYQISTRMIVDAQGRYTDKVEGLPIEGAEKVAAVRRFANARFGQGKWGIEYAYSDHYSDRPLLYAARHAVAVAPDRVLTRTAKEEGWPIVAAD